MDTNVSTMTKPQTNSSNQPAVIAWVRKNLFGSIIDTTITLSILALLIAVVPPLVNWLFIDASFLGSSRDACSGDGACWVFVKEKLYQFFYGFYPETQAWRLNTVFVLFAATVLPLLSKSFPWKKALFFFAISGTPLLSYWLLVGGFAGLEAVPTSKWGGLTLTLIIAITGIVASLPLGICLALGRRSSMPVVRSVSVMFIELWRGVPLITVLFMASVMLPLFLPEGVTFDKLLRALIGVALFSSAYMAEVIRGGLQAIPKGQFEAAASLGLTFWQSMRLIVLPQALQKVIPGIVNTFIGLFKDTTLVLIIGMFDLLGIVQAAATDPEWLGFAAEGYIFAGLVFWIFCFGMSRYSQNLEKRLNTSH